MEYIITIPVFDKVSLRRINADPTIKDKRKNILWPVVSTRDVKVMTKPVFQIQLEKNTTAFNAKVRYMKLQYSQSITLDFGKLSWLHLSVTTLVPAEPVPTSIENIFKKNLRFSFWIS